MKPRLRKFVFTIHLIFAVGWIGAVVAYLALAITGLNSQDDQMARAAYPFLELIGWFVIVPFSLLALISGLIQSLGTEWGLFRYYWILAKFILTTLGITILLVHMRTVSRMAAIAREGTLASGDFRMMRTQLIVHAVGGLLILLTATILSVYKPWGKIQRKAPTTLTSL